MLIALIIVTLICILITLLGWIKLSEATCAFGLTCLVLVGMFGWLLLGNVIPITYTTTDVTANVLHEKNACHLSVDGIIVGTYTDVATFNYLSEKETVKVTKTQWYNMYGGNPKSSTYSISNIQ